MITIEEAFGAHQLGFGGAAISGEGGGYGFGQITSEEAMNLCHYTFERGVRIYDTAPIYGFGESEKRLGQAFNDRRDRVFLVSKCGVSWHDNGRVNMTNEPKEAEKMLGESLKRLQTDVIDLYMVHWPDPRVDIRVTLEFLERQREVGKIRYLGLCNTNQDDLEKAKEITKISVYQSELNLFNQSAFDVVSNECAAKDKYFMSWGTLDKGILSGKTKKKNQFQDRTDARSWAPWWKKSDVDQRIEAFSPVLKKMEEKGIDPTRLPLSYNLNHRKIDLALVGGKSLRQWESLFDSCENLLSVEEVNTLLEGFSWN